MLVGIYPGAPICCPHFTRVAERARVAIILGNGRAALDWHCYEAMLKAGGTR